MNNHLNLMRIILIFLILNTLINNSNVQNNCKHMRKKRFDNEDHLKKFLCNEYESRATDLCTKQTVAEWNHVTDITNKNKTDEALKATIDMALFDKEVFRWYIKDLDISQLTNHDVARQIKKIRNIGYAALRTDLLEELTKILDEMQDIYSTAKICPYKTPKCNVTTQGIPLTPDIENVMANSPDYDELLYTWLAWHDVTGIKMKRPFEYYVVLANEAAIANNFTDRGEMWRSEYEMDNFEAEVDRLWYEVEPLYLELHTYVRHCIHEAYNKELGLEDDGYIASHLLGNMFGQTWINIKGIVTPYPNESHTDIGEILESNNVTVLKMFQMANDFYKSMGLESMEDAFDTKKGAIIEKPKDKTVICHASAWDFCNGTNFKVKMCGKVSVEDFITIHHELGHIQYYMWYKHLPIVYRTGANPSFHEAIGDMLALSIMNPKHFQNLNFIDKSVQVNKHQQINMLMDLALVKVAFLPYGYLMDKWRWDIFAEKIDPDNWNAHYWYYKMKYQRLKPPIVRSNDDFDPGAKFHVSADAQYISYFLAHILEFQIHKALCNARSVDTADEPFEPLHECDLLNNRLAGNKLKHMLKMGSSKHWTFVLKDLTGKSYISTEAILEYFSPLYSFLQHANNAYKNKYNKK